MRELKFDVSRCANGECQVRDHCARYTSKWGEYGQVVTRFEPGPDGCEHFEDNAVPRAQARSFAEWMEGLE